MGRRTAFARWVRRYGVARLARDLGLSRAAVSAWVNGRAMPAVPVAIRIVRLSRSEPTSPGPLDLETIFAPDLKPRGEREAS